MLRIYFWRIYFQKFSTIFLPKPSILNASLDTKCLIFSIATFSHSKPSLEHLLTASIFLVTLLYSFIVFEPQEGQLPGNINLTLFFDLLLISNAFEFPLVKIIS